MKITRVQIRNFRCLKNVDVMLDKLTVLVGENNSGKTSFLKALSLPFMSNDWSEGKRLSWYDINQEAKDEYYSYLDEHREDLSKGSVDIESFQSHVPEVVVTVDIQPNENEGYDVKDLLVNDDGRIIPRICYRWHVTNVQKLLELTVELLKDNTKVQDVKMSLLPTDLYKYEIIVPDECGNKRISYDVLTRFRQSTLSAERDGFASNINRLGSKALISLLQNKIKAEGRKSIEQGYESFFHTIRESAQLDEIINWQDYSGIPNACNLFNEIALLPNMPPMSSLLESVQLGYDDEALALQGLGQRNLILMAVMLNAYVNSDIDLSFRLMLVEEPEAHLCVNNILLMASFFKIFSNHDDQTQLIYTTHSSELVNKIGLNNVVVLHSGIATNLGEKLNAKELDYLAKNPNTDIFTLLFSHRLILVEGLTEELLIKAYLQSKQDLNDIKVLAFHKGFKDIIKIWKIINANTNNKLGIIRDFDNETNAKKEHEALEDKNVCIQTTCGYTLETDIVETGINHKLLIDRYGQDYGWNEMTEDELQKDWRSNKKAEVMLRVAQDLIDGELEGFQLPTHIQKVLDFLSQNDQ